MTPFRFQPASAGDTEFDAQVHQQGCHPEQSAHLLFRPAGLRGAGAESKDLLSRASQYGVKKQQIPRRPEGLLLMTRGKVCIGAPEGTPFEGDACTLIHQILLSHIHELVQLVLPVFGDAMRIAARLQRREHCLIRQQLIHLGQVVSQRRQLVHRRGQFDA